MKYIGNKNRLIPFIHDVISKTSKNCEIFCDIFTGTTNVAQHYKKLGYKIISNDIMTYSYALQQAYIKNNDIPTFKKLLKAKGSCFKWLKNDKELFKYDYYETSNIIQYLNDLKGTKSFIYRNYSNEGTEHKKYKRQYYTGYNASKIDSARQVIESWKKENLIQKNEYFVLLASLINEADYLANISGTYGAFLKIWRSVALNKFKMKIPNLIKSKITHETYKEDANSLIGKVETDILYIDPPYNSRQYASNFHLPETVACYDNPRVYGITGLRPWIDQASRYCSKSTAADAFNDLIQKANAKYIYVSYNNEGIININDIVKILKARGRYRRFQATYRRFRTERDHEKRRYKKCDDKTTEFLHFCEGR